MKGAYTVQRRTYGSELEGTLTQIVDKNNVLDILIIFSSIRL
jgi:hypothetical protein